MPHQCLSCGHLFAEGSSAILQGCPECKGTKFFYTQSAVNEAQRKQMQEKAQKDLRQVVAEVLQEAAPETAARLEAEAGEDGWAQLRPRDLRRLVREVQAEKRQTAARSATEAAPASPEAEARRQEARERVQAIRQEVQGDDEESRPDTVTVEEAGNYAIDVKGLLEKNPIVVHKDGAYLIHLPSLFQDK